MKIKDEIKFSASDSKDLLRWKSEKCMIRAKVPFIQVYYLQGTQTVLQQALIIKA